MIAGEGIIGILLAVLAVVGLDSVIDLSSVYGDAFQTAGNWVGLVAFVLFIFTRPKNAVEVDAKLDK